MKGPEYIHHWERSDALFGWRCTPPRLPVLNWTMDCEGCETFVGDQELQGSGLPTSRALLFASLDVIVRRRIVGGVGNRFPKNRG